MANFSLIRPLDQPPGTRRLLEDLKTALRDSRFNMFRVVVAYAKSGPLLRLKEDLERWRAQGYSLEAVIGLDQQGTSREALELSMQLFDRVYVTSEPGITFHPKMYLFNGGGFADAFIGSNNLTVGGTEKNFEAAVHLQLDLSADAAGWKTLESAWTDLLPDKCPATALLSNTLLAELVKNETVIGERQIQGRRGDSDGAKVNAGSKGKRGMKSGLVVKPESPLPRVAVPRGAASGAAATGVSGANGGGAAGQGPTSVVARGLAIQIKPHDNGEIFLSVTAAMQNPAFFGWPFTGQTTPKKKGNESYPQRTPDPIVNIDVYGKDLESVLALRLYALNTVYYAPKSEIRITASPLVELVPEYSIMIIELSATSGVDYEIAIHRPDSPQYGTWLVACNQTMPGGGRTARRYGWF